MTKLELTSVLYVRQGSLLRILVLLVVILVLLVPTRTQQDPLPARSVQLELSPQLLHQ